MKLRVIVFLIAVGLVALGLWSMRARRPAPARSPSPTAPVDVAAPTPMRTPAPQSTPAPAASEVAIQDGKTIDFSSGKPVVKGDAEQKAKIDDSVKQMDAVAGGVTFGPTPSTTTSTTASTPTVPPPSAPTN